VNKIPVFFFGLIQGIRHWLHNLRLMLIPSYIAVFELAQQFWLSKAIGVACELNIADHLLQKPTHYSVLAEKTGTNPVALYRLLRALAGSGIFREKAPGVFDNTRLSRALTDRKPSMKYMIKHQLNSSNWLIVNELCETIHTGENAAQRILGTSIFEHLSSNPEKNELYNKAMAETSEITGAIIARSYNFSEYKKVVDLGGGKGNLLAAIMKQNQHIEGVVFDLPHVVADAKQMFDELLLGNRISILAGSFFDTIPQGCDVYLLKNIIHAFDDTTCHKILGNIRKVIPQNGIVLLVEIVIEKRHYSAFGSLFDLQMLLATEGGKERTKPEFAQLFSSTGFELTRVLKTLTPFSIIEAKPR